MPQNLLLQRKGARVNTTLGGSNEQDVGTGLQDSLFDPLQKPTQDGDDGKQQKQGAKEESPFLARLKGLRPDVKENPDKPGGKDTPNGTPSDDLPADPSAPSGSPQGTPNPASPNGQGDKQQAKTDTGSLQDKQDGQQGTGDNQVKDTPQVKGTPQVGTTGQGKVAPTQQVAKIEPGQPVVGTKPDGSQGVGQQDTKQDPNAQGKQDPTVQGKQDPGSQQSDTAHKGDGKGTTGGKDQTAQTDGGNQKGDADKTQAKDSGSDVKEGGDQDKEDKGEGVVDASGNSDADEVVVDSGATTAVTGGDEGNGDNGSVEPTLGVPDLKFSAPLVPPDVAKGVLAQTGKKPEVHAQVIQKRLAELKSLAQALQQQVVAAAQTEAQNLRTQVQARVADVQARASGVRGSVTTLFSNARAAVTTAAQNARGAVEGGRKNTITSLGNDTKAAKSTIETKYKAQADTYTKMKTGEMEPFNTLFGEFADKAKGSAKGKSEELSTMHKACDAYFDKGGSDLDSYLGMVRAEYAKKKLPAAASDMVSGGQTRFDQIIADKTAIAQSLVATLDPLITQCTTLSTQATKALDDAHTSALTKLGADADQAIKSINASEKAALGELTTKEKGATDKVDAASTRIQGDVKTQGEAVHKTMTTMSAQLADTWRAKVQGIQGGLPTKGPVTADQLEGFFKDTHKSMQELSSSQQGQITKASGETLTKVMGDITQGLTKFDPITGEIEADLSTWQDGKTKGLEGVAGGFTGALTQLGQAIKGTLTQWLAPLDGDLKTHQTHIKSEMAKLLGTSKKELQKKQDEYLADLTKSVTKFCQMQEKGADENAEAAESKVDDRARQAYSAMRGLGTDEDKLFNAVRGMKSREPCATEQVFGSISGGQSITGWAYDELDSEEYKIFTNHFNLNHGAAARLEIKYNCNWYGDDEAQIEAILRGMPEDARKDIKNSKEWESTKKLLADNLDGNDLKVANALMDNNVAKADAIRLKEKVDEARLKGDHDALHDALAGMDQEKIGDIAVEFSKLDGVAAKDAPATAIPTVDPKTGQPLTEDQKKAAEQEAAKKMMADYTTREVERFPGDRHKMKIEGANADLAKALIMNGADSTESKVARFQVELTRPGGAKGEKMEQALYVDAATQEGLHSPDPKVREEAQKKAKQQQDDFNAKYEKAYGKKPSDAIKDSGQDKDKKELYGLMLEKGYNSPEVAEKQIKEAIKGCGTDEDAIKRALKGMSPDEVKQLRERYPNLDKDLGTDGGWGELSGSDRQEVDILLMGDPKHMNDDQRFELAKKKRDQQVGSESGVLSGLVMGGSYEEKALSENFDKLEQFRKDNAGKFKNGKFDGSPEEYAEYKRLCKYVGVTSELYQEQTDRIANYATTAIAVTGAIVGTVVTGGVAGPMLAAAVTGLASMGVNRALKGGRYGWEAAATDLAVTGVNVATAGLGGKLNAAKGGAGIFGGQVAKATTELGKNAWTIGGKTTVAALTGGLGSAGTTALQDETWKNGFGKGMGEVFYSGWKGAATSAVSTAVGESFATIPGIKKMADADSYFKKPLANAFKGSLSNMASKSTELFIDSKNGKFNGELDDAAQQVGLEGLKGFGSGAFEGIGEVKRGRREAAAKTKQEEAKKAEEEQKRVAEEQKKAAEEQKRLAEQQQKAQEAEKKATEELQHVDEQSAKKVEVLNDKADQQTDETGQVKPEGPELKKEEVQPKVDKIEEDVEQTKKEVVREVVDEKKAVEEQNKQVEQQQEQVQKKVEEVKSGNDDATDQETTTKKVGGTEEEEPGLHKDPADEKAQQEEIKNQVHDDQVKQAEHTEAELKKALGDLTDEEQAAVKALIEQGMDPTAAIAKVKVAPEQTPPPDKKATLSDDEIMAELVGHEKTAKLSKEQIDHVLGGKDAEERQARLEEVRAQAKTRLEGYDSYPKSLIDADQVTDQTELQQRAKQVVAEFNKPGQEAALAALQKLDGDPKAQLELAHHLAVFKSILTKDFNQVANNPQEMISLVKAHAALKQAQMDMAEPMRKFLAEGDAKNMLEKMAWDRNQGKMVKGDISKVGGCVGDSRNTDGMNAQEAAHVLGLDYRNSPFTENQGANIVAKKESFYIDFKRTAAIDDLAKVTFASPIVDKILEMSFKMPEADFLLQHIKERNPSGVDDPNTGTGGTAAGINLGKGKMKTVNQEMHMGGSADLPDGTVMYKRLDDGSSVPVAKYTVGTDGKGTWSPITGNEGSLPSGVTL